MGINSILSRTPLLYLSLLLVGGVLLSSLFWLPFNPYDEGIILVGADRIVGGEKPYLDFWTLYPPGQFYTLAWLFAGIEHAAWVERAYDLVVKTLIGAGLFALVDTTTRQRKVALMVWGLAIVWMSYRDFVLYPIFPCVLLVVLSLNALLQYLREPRLGWLLGSTGALVLSALYRVDLGVLAGVAILAALMVRRWALPQAPGNIVHYGLSCVLMAAPVLALLHTQFGITRLFEHLIAAPASLIPDFRALPYPGFGLSSKKLPFYLFPLILITGAVISLRDMAFRKQDSMLGMAMLLVSLTGIVFLNQVRVRSDFIHLMPSALLAIAVLGLLFAGSRGAHASGHRWHKVLRGLLGLLLLLTFYKPLYEQIKEFSVVARPATKADRYNDRVVSIVLPDDLQAVLTWVAEHTQATDTLYVGVTNHDRFLVNDVALYFLAQRHPATRYHELHPGVTTTEAVQREMIGELQQHSPAALILAPNYHHEANRAAEDAGIELLDGFIRDHYAIRFKAGDLEIWQKK